MKKRYANEISGEARLKYRIAALDNANKHTDMAGANVGGDEENKKKFGYHTTKAYKRLRGIEAAKHSAATRPKTEDISHLGASKMENKRTLEEWMGALQEAGYDTADIDEGKLGRLAAGLGLAGAAMMGGAKDAGAQQATPTKAPTTQDAAGKQWSDMADYFRTAQSGRQGGIRAVPVDSLEFVKGAGARSKLPDTGAQSATSPKQDGTTQSSRQGGIRLVPTGAPQMEEAYTLEEWMGMMEEAGYPINEFFKLNPFSKIGKFLTTNKLQGKEDEFSYIGHNDRPMTPDEEKTRERGRKIAQRLGVNLNELSPETLASYRDKAATQRKSLADKNRPTEPSTHIDNTMKSPDAVKSGDARTYFKRGAGIGRAQGNLEQGRFTGGGQERGVSDTELQNRRQSSWGNKDDKLSKLINPTGAHRVAGDPYSHLRGSTPKVDKYIDADRAAALRLPKGQPKMAAESINENTVSRLQQLAGIKPTE